MPQHPLDDFHIGARADGERGCGVAQFVRREARLADGCGGVEPVAARCGCVAAIRSGSRTPRGKTGDWDGR